MMIDSEIEIKLLQDYLEAAWRAKTPEDANKRLTLYEKQLELCRSKNLDFNAEWCEAMVYYIKANHKLDTEGFAEKVLRDTARQSAGFEGLLPAMAAKGRETGRLREAIALLNQAISIYEDDVDFWFMRARLYHALREKEAALRDVNHILSNYDNNQEIYLKTRKLKDEVEAINDSKTGCFIASAIYETPDSPQLTILRDYRDQVLLTSSIGRVIVTCYYSISPHIARVLSKSRRAKLFVRITLLDPFVASLNWRKKRG